MPSWYLVYALTLPSVYALSHYDPKTDANLVVCSYPVTSHYGALQRFKFYTFIICAALGYRYFYLSGAAMAAVMFCAAISAIHAILLAIFTATLRRNYDLDAFGAWSVLSCSVIVLGPMMRFFPIFYHPKVKSILRIWGALVIAGAVCAFVTLTRTYPQEPLCVALNCTYDCLSFKQPMRSPSEIVLLPKSVAFGERFGNVVPVIGIITLVMTLPSIVACLPFVEGEEGDGALAGLGPSNNQASVIAVKGWQDRQSNEWFRMDRRGWLLYWWKALRFALAFGSVPFAVAVVVLNERYLCQTKLPVVEQPVSVGQWGPWVAVALAILADWIYRRGQKS